jgi:hypothetical protein
MIKQSDPQFAVGIFGGWGSGKTTLMQAIERELDPSQMVAVRFSAWRYEKEEHLIVPLLDTVREALVEWGSGRPAQQDRARRTAATIGRVMRSILAGMSMKVGVPGAIDVSFDANKALAEHRAGAPPADEADVPGSFYHASFRALREAFEEFVAAGPEPDRRIVVFVDDLDRCLPDSALQVLESMKLFFDLPGFVFVVGLDQDVVEYVIDAKYTRPATAGEDRTQARISGAEYIKKIFQLPFRLAPVAIDQLEDFLAAAYHEAGLQPDQRTELETRVAPHLRYVAGEAAVNPREIKRYINAYTLLVEIDVIGRLDPAAVLALQTIAFRTDWSRVQDALLEFEDVFVDALRRRAHGEATALLDLDPDLQAIPDEFLEYVADGAPGHRLLTVGALAPYLSSGEAVRSTQDPALLEAIRAAGRVRSVLRHAAAPDTNLENLVPEALKELEHAMSAARSVSASALTDAFATDVRGLTGELEDIARKFGGVQSPDQGLIRTTIAEQLEPAARDIARRLVRIYRQGDAVRSPVPA